MADLYARVHGLIGEGRRVQMLARLGYAQPVIAAPRRGVDALFEAQGASRFGHSARDFHAVFAVQRDWHHQPTLHDPVRGGLPHRLTVAQFSLLNHLVRLGDDELPARLAAAFQVTKGAMSNTIQKLELKGFVTVRPDPDDGRAKRVMLTEAGKRARTEAIRASAPVLEQITHALTAEEVQAIRPPLRKLRIWLDENR